MRFAGAFLALASSASPLAAQDDLLTLARELTNPFADVVNFPINQNADFGIGADEGWRYTLTLQPVIPFALDADWNIISRSVVPVIVQDNAVSSDSGLGDIVQSFFLSPTNAADNGWCWGAGPIFLLPTASDRDLGADQWGLGPTVGLLNRSGPWTAGLLANHIWSLEGAPGKSDVNSTFLQPFIDFTLESLTTISVNTESTYDWTNQQWTVPIHLVVRQLLDLGGQKVSIALGSRYYADAPDGGPDWGVRLGVTLIFPR